MPPSKSVTKTVTKTMPQPQADKLIAKVAQPLPRHYNGQGYAAMLLQSPPGSRPLILPLFCYSFVQGRQGFRLHPTLSRVLHEHFRDDLDRSR